MDVLSLERFADAAIFTYADGSITKIIIKIILDIGGASKLLSGLRVAKICDNFTLNDRKQYRKR
jgi:hypothetical protein